MDDLTVRIKELIERKKEGVFWDFKRKWHDNNADLLRDILSLSNAIDHKGRRFLIFGVDDEDYTLHCQSTVDKRKQQAELLDMLANTPFLGDYTPEVSVDTLKLNDKDIDVIIIEDRPFKPYCLRKKHLGVSAGTVYSRAGDRNTAKDRNADLHHVEMMWRERLGIDKPPLERVKQLLGEIENWICPDDEAYHHKYFPEFTIEFESIDKKVDSRFWWSKLGGKDTTMNRISLKYHSTVLYQKLTFGFPLLSKEIVLPDIKFITVDDVRLPIFNCVQNSIEFHLMNFMLPSVEKFAYKDLLLKGTLCQHENKDLFLPLIIFESENEQCEFLIKLESSVDQFTNSHNFSDGHGRLQIEQAFSYWAYDFYHDDFKVTEVHYE